MNILEWIISWIAKFLVFIEVQPTTINILVTIGILVFILLGILLLSWESSRYRTPRKSAGPKPSYQPNATNGLVAYGPSYPFVYKLTSEDGTQGWYVKKEDGPHSWLSINGDYYSALIMRPVMKPEIEAIEEALKEGDTFYLRLSPWKREKEITFDIEVVEGTNPTSFTSLNYILGSNELGDLVLLENPTIPNKPNALETWTQHDLAKLSEEEFNTAVGEILDKVKK